MTERVDEVAPLDARDPLALLAAAAGDLPVPESPVGLDEMVEVALLAAAGRRARRVRWWVGSSMAAAALLSFGVGASLAWSGSGVAPMNSQFSGADAPRALSRLSLPTGDHIVRLGRGVLDIDRSTARERRFSVADGQVLFDVVPLREGERFEVTTPHLRATVIGTVFALDVEPDGTRLQVFEGTVRVYWGEDRARDLRRGQRFDSRTGVAPGRWRSDLFDEGLFAARRRTGRSVAPSADPPSADPPSADPPSADPPISDPPSPDPQSTEPSRGAPGRAEAEPSPSPVPQSPLNTRTLATLAAARGWLADGEVERALSAAERACAAAPQHGGWQLLRADSLRASGRFRAAAGAYDVAARVLPPSRATAAGYLAAHLRLNRLGDAEGALRALEQTGAADPGSPMEERAMVLSIRAYRLTGDRSAAEATGRRYLTRFPSGSSRAWVEGVVDAE